MSTVILDECLQNLFYAQESLKEWIPMSDYEIIFEASENKDTAEKVEKNEKVESKTVGFVRKAIDAVIGLIKRIFESIGDFIRRCTMSGDEREAFNAFKKAMAQDPSLKNKKITVKDFRNLNKEYDDLLVEIDQNIRTVKNNEEHPIDDIVKKVTDFTKGAATAVSVNIAADAALKSAESNVGMAKALRNTLKQENGILEALSKTLGEKGAKNFEKKINAAAKQTILHRLKVKLLGHKYDSLSDVVAGTIRTMTGAGFRDLKEIKEAKKQLKDDKKSGAISKDEYKKSKAELNAAAKRAKAEAIDTVQLGKRLGDNEYTGKIVKPAVSAAKDAYIDTMIDNSIVGKAIEKHKEKKAAKKKSESALGFMFKHDKKSKK